MHQLSLFPDSLSTRPWLSPRLLSFVTCFARALRDGKASEDVDHKQQSLLRSPLQAAREKSIYQPRYLSIRFIREYALLKQRGVESIVAHRQELARELAVAAN